MSRILSTPQLLGAFWSKVKDHVSGRVVILTPMNSACVPKGDLGGAKPTTEVLFGVMVGYRSAISWGKGVSVDEKWGGS